jgi:hypothetical protein
MNVSLAYWRIDCFVDIIITLPLFPLPVEGLLKICIHMELSPRGHVNQNTITTVGHPSLNAASALVHIIINSSSTGSSTTGTTDLHEISQLQSTHHHATTTSYYEGDAVAAASLVKSLMGTLDAEVRKRNALLQIIEYESAHLLPPLLCDPTRDLDALIAAASSTNGKSQRMDASLSTTIPGVLLGGGGVSTSYYLPQMRWIQTVVSLGLALQPIRCLFVVLGAAG